jgi:hypothetical protein
MVRVHKLLTGDHEEIANANGRNRDFPEDITEEQRDQRLLEDWYPPEYFFEKYGEMEVPQRATTTAAEGFVVAADTLIVPAARTPDCRPEREAGRLGP